MLKSPFALSKTERQKLIKALETRLDQKVILEEKIDPDLLAGLSIRAGDDIFDSSLRKNLSFIKEAMVRE